ncbi:hypothetical protein Mpsy_3135 [Methanolobus psychrophilus R15]|nr:hypothetical protein Mpsy_3135 [Methanolobus psychrophilus R15]
MNAISLGKVPKLFYEQHHPEKVRKALHRCHCSLNALGASACALYYAGVIIEVDKLAALDAAILASPLPVLLVGVGIGELLLLTALTAV